ncbi:phosphotransferase enzyme family protein [Sutcliffiella rhizosphaerae]|uniref:Homoserine kinase n=1 Tax=Sutcliffiella rhizosphaerae TaxID=2880967 RepID=A0ABM8YQ23_9BACI|nr:phosphotransferase [Sutcliffiella rhizosphaerae]CAG9622105.1 Homoserine kinase [Sutcliffiella rhizosphaerae]
MNLLDMNNISSSFGIKTIEFKTLSERAILIITSGEDKFILKEKGTLEQIKREIKLLKHLQYHFIHTQTPIMNDSGEYTVCYKNKNYCIYNYLEGLTFHAEESLLNPSVPKLLGETIAHLNQAMKTIRFSNEFPNNDIFLSVYSFAVDEIVKVDASEHLITIYQQLKEDIKAVLSTLPKQVIHRDAHIHNIVIKDDTLVGLIDFDLAEVNVNIFDICYCSTSILSEVFSNETQRLNWLSFVGDLIANYNQHNSLSMIEKRGIWYVMLCIQSVFMAYFSKNKDIFKSNKEMFLWIYENKSNLERKYLIS